MLISLVRTIVLYSFTVIALRIMGKRQVGQLEPIELVVTLMISDLASVPMGNNSIPLIHGIIPILTLVILEAVLSFMNLKSRKFRKIMSGVPVIIIRHGKIIEEELERIRLNIDDLMEELRISGNIQIQEIEYAIFETNGTLSVIPKAVNAPLTPEDMGINMIKEQMPFLLICDGVVNENALKISGRSEDWLKKKLKEKGIKRTEHILYAGVDSSGELYFQRKEQK